MEHAVASGQVEVMEWVLREVQGGQWFHDGPLHAAHAASCGHEAAVKWLIAERGVDESDHAALLIAAKTVKILDLLLEGGCQIDAVDDCGDFALKMAVQDEDPVRVEQLLTRGASLANASADGMAALHWAAGMDHDEIVDLLLRHGADPNQEDLDGDVPLSLSASVQMAERLIAAGANLNGPHWSGTVRKRLVEKDPAFARRFA